MATVSGPLQAQEGAPFGTPTTDLSAVGYQEEEYFFCGTATRFGPKEGTALGWDGRWDVEPIGTAPYRSRLVVYRPTDPTRFNGTVLVSWNNVTSGFDSYTVNSPGILEEGYAYVAVSAQRAGVHGIGDDPKGLVQQNPARYGGLSIPSDDYSFDIFSQAARAVGAERPRSPHDPLGGLEVHRLAAFGGSQSASRLGAYINAVQPKERIFDAFFLYLYFGGGSPLNVGQAVYDPRTSNGKRPPLPAIPCRIREDINALVLIVNSELEAISCYTMRQPDSDRLRCWEVAGTAHMSWQSTVARASALGGSVSPAQAEAFRGINEVPLKPVLEASYRWLQKWLATGTAPPSHPRITFADDAAEVLRDEHGIARGGIRLPQVEVPLATNSAIPADSHPDGALAGSCVPFSPEKVRSLYGDAQTYLARFEEATRAAVKAGAVLAADGEELVREAKAAWVRAVGAN